METAKSAVASGRGRAAVRELLRTLLVVFLCALPIAFLHPSAPRSTQAQSPDGFWLAVARTGSAGWFDKSDLETTVFLERREGQTNPVDSLWEHQPWRPITIVRLTHPAPAPTGDGLVQMRWLTPTHLEVAYRGKARLDYHLPDCSGVHIFVRPVGDRPPGGEAPGAID
jgi:hypothetical protein